VVKGLIELIKIRNDSNAFNGDFSVSYNDKLLALNWAHHSDTACLEIDFNTMSAVIDITDAGKSTTITISELLG
jgi:sucrose phosphorylase